MSNTKTINGFDNYYISENGKITKGSPNGKEIKTDSLHRVYLTDRKGNTKRATLKKLYKQNFEKEFCIDTIENLTGELWKEIPNTSGKYFVSNQGRIKSYCGYSAIILKAEETEKGYLSVKVNSKNERVHRLVAFAFCQYDKTKKFEDLQVHHIDQNKKNNRAENLLILSPKEHNKIHNVKKENSDK